MGCMEKGEKWREEREQDRESDRERPVHFVEAGKRERERERDVVVVFISVL